MRYTLENAEALEVLLGRPSGSVQCCVTSPPYWKLRDYHHAQQIGLENTVEEYLERLLIIFAEVRRLLAPDGTCWVNLGDTFNNYLGGTTHESDGVAGYADDSRPRFASGSGLLDSRLPRKCLMGVPYRFALAMLKEGWLLREQVTWAKATNLPDTATDRPDHNSEPIFLFTKRPDYKCDRRRLPRAFRGSVWHLPCGRRGVDHPAVFPDLLARLCITASTDPGDLVLDPFAGSGTTGVVALELRRRALLAELNPEYCANARRALEAVPEPLALSV